MRVTIALLGFGLGAVMFAQTFLIYGLSNVISDSDSSSAAQAGLSMVVLWLFAIAFVFGVPWLSLAMFVIAGAVGIANAAHFPDLQIWGIASLILAGMTAFQLWKDHKAKHLSPTISSVATAGAVRCPSCRAINPASSKFCSSCGNTLANTACPACGTQASPGAAFCGDCGAALSTAAQPIPVVTTKKKRGHVPLAVGFSLFAVGQLLALGRDGGILGWGNFFGVVFLVVFVAWLVYWVRRNGTGGIRLPSSVWSILGVRSTNQAEGSPTQPRFPFAYAVGALAIAGVVSFVISSLDARYSSIRINGGGMSPALPDGTMWTISYDAYSSAMPQRGDLIVYTDDGEQGQSVKRVIGLPGEEVTFANGIVYVDGVELHEPYTEFRTRCTRGDYCDVALEDNELFVLGDNRENSADSRTDGPVDLADVRGKIIKPFFQLGLK